MNAASARPASVVGVDLGGTKIAAARVDASGALGPVVTVPTPAASGPGAVLAAVAAAVREAAGGEPCAAVGVGTAGAVDAARGVVVSATDTFADWVGTDLVAGLRARLGDLTVAVRNDVDAHLLGEMWRGAASGARSVLMVAAGTGIGGALVLDGALRTGAHHLAGEIGHVPAVGAVGLACPCGRTGHLEAVAAGPAIHRRYRALGGERAADTRAVFADADAGDVLAADVIEDAAVSLGRAIAGLVTCLDPEFVVVGGGLAQAGPRWWAPFEATLRAELVDALAGLPVVPAALGAEAAIVGAARAALDELADHTYATAVDKE